MLILFTSRKLKTGEQLQSLGVRATILSNCSRNFFRSLRVLSVMIRDIFGREGKFTLGNFATSFE